MRELILASASPRRKELLTQIGMPFQIIKSEVEEKITKQVPSEIVEELSWQKASDVASRIEEGIVLGADTIVCLGDRVMGKPEDREHAKEMLRELQGKVHSVYTGVTLIKKIRGEKDQIHSFFRETKVHVFPMTEEEIERYLDTGDAFDKAGSYGIQGPFAAYIDRIEGDYNNVVGLPVSAVYQELKKI